MRLRAALIDPGETDAYRLVHGEADGYPGWYLDRYGEFLLSESEAPETPSQKSVVSQHLRIGSLRGAYHKPPNFCLQGTPMASSSPLCIQGDNAPEEIVVRENGLRFAIRLNEGLSVGLFLDQRDNRRRLCVNHVAAGFPLCADGWAGREILNTFAYTCGYSVCAAHAGARCTSVDLSQKYLDWGRRNFVLNGLDPAAHAFLFGDVFDWMRRLAKKKQRFDVVILDPPTFSTSKQSGPFRAERDFSRLVNSALPLLKDDGVLFASTNAATFSPEKFLEAITGAVQSAHRQIRQQHYVPQPPDFPIHRSEPAYLKTVWMRISR
ncbi:MAG: class I SAM-dependent rRNA methyltransferase [Candidatus Omnitrophica bacterium]|nr:class I SAM-dependent rRNA methyltransferase [Candidatus Omnitrophota bacterium]